MISDHKDARLLVTALCAICFVMCDNAVSRRAIPPAAARLTDGVYIVVLEKGKGLSGNCGELYGYDSTEIGRSWFRRSAHGEDHAMLKRSELSPEWRTVLMSMREGDSVRAWIKQSTGAFRVYEIRLARVDRLDATGVALVDQHDLPCKTTNPRSVR
jgi:hypothetical protein